MRALSGLRILIRVLRRNGIYSGKSLEERLATCVGAVRPELGAFNPITFNDLARTQCHPLKIVATNLAERRAIIYSTMGDGQGDESVLSAVRASASYPWLFQPVSRSASVVLSDGGISSNLPAFLFAKEHLATGYPIIAFDLVSERPALGRGPLAFAGALLGTALEASDMIMADTVSGILRIPIRVNPPVGTLDFDLDNHHIEGLYNAGYTCAAAALNQYEKFVVSRQAGENIQRQLQAIHGDQKLFDVPLRALIAEMKSVSAATSLRAQVMLPTGRENNSRIVVYSHGVREGDGDADLEIGEFSGCTGRALRLRAICVADLSPAERADGKWDMTAAQHGRVAGDRRAMIAVPIFGEGARTSEMPILGSLSVDSSTPIDETNWVDLSGGAASPAINPRVKLVITGWADVLAKMLRS